MWLPHDKRRFEESSSTLSFVTHFVVSWNKKANVINCETWDTCDKCKVCIKVFHWHFLFHQITKCDHGHKVDLTLKKSVTRLRTEHLVFVILNQYLYCCTPLTKEKTSLYLPKWIKNVRVNLKNYYSMYYPFNCRIFLPEIFQWIFA